MDLRQRIDLLAELGIYMLSGNEKWVEAKQKAAAENKWFLPEFIDTAENNIVTEFLQQEKLENWMQAYPMPGQNPNPLNIGIVMAGNIPLVGFHDFLNVFISGHRQTIKPSAKDEVLIRHVAAFLADRDPAVKELIYFADRLKGCDAYIATGGNNSGRYFNYYFGKYPHIIRHNRTSVAILDGTESSSELENLADDTHLYFGLGCRNVTKLYFPAGYDPLPLLESFKKYAYFSELSRYNNNYDYQLALLILNNKYYMTNGEVILVESGTPFSPISVLHYEYYNNHADVLNAVVDSPDIQCLAGHGLVPFGKAQKPALAEYADGTDTLQFLLDL